MSQTKMFRNVHFADCYSVNSKTHIHAEILTHAPAYIDCVSCAAGHVSLGSWICCLIVLVVLPVMSAWAVGFAV